MKFMVVQTASKILRRWKQDR